MREPDPSSGTAHETPFPDQLAHTTLRAFVALSTARAVLFIVGGLIASWMIIYVAGGADSMVPHWYYIPILFAATRFGPIPALVVALVAGILAGPLTYEDVAAATDQDLARWVTRTGFFVGIGFLMGLLVKPSLRPIGEELRLLRLRYDIRRGLVNNEFFLRYQPIYSIEEDAFTGAEALIRWQHPIMGELAPAYFIEAAEGSSLIHEISEFVLDEVCRQAAEWQSTAREHGVRPWYVAANLSARDTEWTNLAQHIEKVLKRHELPPDLLHIEITESILAAEGAEFQLRHLKRLGIQLVIDDFGIGYSSLSYLNRFPVDVLKIDRSLISRLDVDASSQTLARCIVYMAHSLGLVTVAEGLETNEQLCIGTAMNFDYVQGYYFARPLQGDQIPELIVAGVKADREVGKK